MISSNLNEFAQNPRIGEISGWSWVPKTQKVKNGLKVGKICPLKLKIVKLGEWEILNLAVCDGNPDCKWLQTSQKLSGEYLWQYSDNPGGEFLNLSNFTETKFPNFNLKTTVWHFFWNRGSNSLQLYHAKLTSIFIDANYLAYYLRWPSY